MDLSQKTTNQRYKAQRFKAKFKFTAAGINSRRPLWRSNMEKISTTAKTGNSVKEESKAGRLFIGGTTYFVTVHFGKIPLEEILKNRILNGSKRP
jgi:hypothetical protein